MHLVQSFPVTSFESYKEKEIQVMSIYRSNLFPNIQMLKKFQKLQVKKKNYDPVSFLFFINLKLIYIFLSGRMILPFQPLSIAFLDVQYYIDTPQVLIN